MLSSSFMGAVEMCLCSSVQVLSVFNRFQMIHKCFTHSLTMDRLKDRSLDLSISQHVWCGCGSCCPCALGGALKRSKREPIGRACGVRSRERADGILAISRRSKSSESFLSSLKSLNLIHCAGAFRRFARPYLGAYAAISVGNCRCSTVCALLVLGKNFMCPAPSTGESASCTWTPVLRWIARLVREGLRIELHRRVLNRHFQYLKREF